MTDEQIVEGNIVIAGFMGLKKYKYEQWSKPENIVIINGEDYSEEWISRFYYHSSWDWLMPVVEKIESIHHDYHGYFAVHIYSNSCTIQGTNFNSNDPEKVGVYMSDPLAVLDTKMESTWFNVVQFIKFYNTDTKQHS